MKILVVEDDQSVAQTLKLLLSSYNYAVDIAVDGKAGLQMAEAFEYDLIVLDVGLPGLDGVSLCQQLRAREFQLPILLVTGRGEGHQKAIALNAGADDYVVKPFDAEELMARVQALLRRGHSATQPILTWGNLCVDPISCKATYGPHLLSPTPKEYAILELLLRNTQRIFSASTILEHVWNSIESPGEEAVRVHIKEIRQKLKKAGAPPDLIKTVYGTGYRLNPLYSSITAQVDQQPTVPQIVELISENEELQVALEELRAAQAELRQQNEALAIAHHKIELELQHRQQLEQQLQATQDELERQVTERTTSLALVQANIRLHQREQLWQALFDHALDAIAHFISGQHLLILRDVSDRKHAESKLQETLIDLFGALEKLQVATEELQQQNVELLATRQL
jgi:DNA-binding response OmpR family regulator